MVTGHECVTQRSEIIKQVMKRGHELSWTVPVLALVTGDQKSRIIISYLMTNDQKSPIKIRYIMTNELKSSLSTAYFVNYD